MAGTIAEADGGAGRATGYIEVDCSRGTDGKQAVHLNGPDHSKANNGPCDRKKDGDHSNGSKQRLRRAAGRKSGTIADARERAVLLCHAHAASLTVPVAVEIPLAFGHVDVGAGADDTVTVEQAT